jgi:aspartate-semialdehyde dehydrogenase
MAAIKQKIPVGVLAATGAVGQRFVSLLADHPWFEVAVVTGSERSAGKRYREAVNWVLSSDIPPGTADLIVQPTDANPGSGKAVLLFSALPSSVAKEIEPPLAQNGYVVCSNASAYRMAEDVPLIIPEINADHISLIAAQREQRGWQGLIVTSPNCAATSVVFPLKALYDAFGLTQAQIVTMQAISGAGYPGVASFDILDNIVPYIGNEEDKIEIEPRKMLGRLNGRSIELAEIAISAQVNRVPVLDGHVVAMSVSLGREAALEEVLAALEAFESPASVRDLPSAPARPLIVHHAPDRPQPRRDRDASKGMAASVGRVRPCPVFDYKMVALTHNTIRGAAGGAILNAELLVSAGYVPEAAAVLEAVS